MELFSIRIRRTFQLVSTPLTAIRPLKDETQEKMNIINALKACNGHREQAAAMLKINPATLYRKMKKYGLK
jgi:two-component system response regulator HydG